MNSMQHLKAKKDMHGGSIILMEDIIPWHDENGILYVGIEQFLLEENAVVYKRVMKISEKI